MCDRYSGAQSEQDVSNAIQLRSPSAAPDYFFFLFIATGDQEVWLNSTGRSSYTI